jgi:hypothetical protein
MPHRLTNNYQADVMADHPILGETWRPGKARRVTVVPTLCLVWPERRMAFGGAFTLIFQPSRRAQIHSCRPPPRSTSLPRPGGDL